MGLLKIFSKPGAAVHRLPSGTITVDRQGDVVTTTISSAYPDAQLREIAGEVLALFKEARTAQMPLSSLTIDFASLRITAREMRGGAIIFLNPVSTFATSPPF